MNPDSTFMSDMTGTRDKGVGTRAEGTGRQGFRIQEEKSRQPLFGLFCLSGLFGLSGRTAARQWPVRPKAAGYRLQASGIGIQEAGRREPTAAASQQ